jgi:5'-3' exonuclease
LETYKQGRKTIKLNRNYDFNLDNPEENKLKQRLRLGEYLSDLPIFQINISQTEADDIIALLCQHYKNEEKVILSNDKDFFQLMNEKTKIYNPYRKAILTQDDVLKEYRN